VSRKNPFASLDLAALNAEAQARPAPGYGMTGAAKTVVRSIEEMAESTKRLMEGEAIIELDPDLVDASPIADRLQDDEDEYVELRSAISTNGQSSPILVRPHPDVDGRYIVVFGHRRLRVARELGSRVRAVVKKLDDIASAIAQGQENSARSNLSFIERAFFARNLLEQGMTKDVVKSAMGIDDAMLSKMLGVIEAVPHEIVSVLGACKKIGRDKWLSLRQLLLNPAHLEVARSYVASDDFVALDPEKRFDVLHEYMKRYQARSVARRPKKEKPTVTWAAADAAASAKSVSRTKSIVVEFSNVEGKAFGDWITRNLDTLYEAFRHNRKVQAGD
jgi:ParB family chromosome partitioning protein